VTGTLLALKTMHSLREITYGKLIENYHLGLGLMVAQKAKQEPTSTVLL
jgi:hypothetical protein